MMAASRHIDRICIIAAVCTLLLTILFMNGQRLGITVMADEDAGDGQFTSNDLDADWAEEADDVTQITLTGDGAEIHGNGAYYYDGGVQIVYAGRYRISGQLDNGSLIVNAESGDKIWLLMDGASISNDDGAAIVVKQAEKVFLTLAEGTENEVAGWAADTSASGGSGGVDGAIYSRDDLTINGNGSLTVTSGYQHAIVCNDDLVITGGRIAVTAPQDGLHANDSVRIAGADLTIHAGDDGVTASNDDNTSYFYMESGSITIPSCYEGIEAIDVIINGGSIDITPTDDGINANGYGTSTITIAGGDIRIVNPTGRDADGLDSNGSIIITGGNLFISMNGNGSNCALDCGTESGGVCEISGGTVIATGGSSMAEGFDSSSEQCFLMQTVSATAENASVVLRNESGETLLSETVPCSFTSILLSTPQLQMGETCTVVIDGTETEVVIDNSTAGGFGMGMGGFGAGGSGMRGQFGGMKGGMGKTPPQMPEGETPVTNGDFSPPDRGAADWQPGQSTGITQPDQNADFMQRGQNTDFMQRGQHQNQNTPAAQAESIAVSPEIFFLIGVSALCLITGLLIAWRIKH